MTSNAMPHDREAVPSDARRLFDLQHAASRRMPAPDADARRAALDRLRRLIVENDQAFATAISSDFGNRSRHETEIMEIVPLLNAIRFARRRLEGWMKPRRHPVDMTFQPARSWVRHEPLGVVGIISPWNYPLLLALGPLVDVLAAGNRALIKPSELTPTFSALLQRIVAGHFDAGQVAVVTGDAEAAAAFSALPFDHLLFTGSTSVGRKVMQAAAANLTPVTLELGGKSPALVCADYALEDAARSIALGKFVNAGQTCIAPDYALVPATHVREFAEALMARVRTTYPKIAGNPDYSSIVSQHHHDRLTRAIAEAEASGATIWRHEDSEGSTRRLGPTLVLGASPTSLLMTEEIFGPVLPIVPYEHLDDALAFIGTRDRPLALYCFSRDKAVREKVLDGAVSGGVTLNGTLLHVAQDALPFGGIGASGMGAYHGHEGFRRFSHARAVHQIGPFSVFERLGPPWGRLATTMARMLRWR